MTGIPPFEVAWRTIDGLEVRYATGGKGGEKVVLFSPWPESGSDFESIVTHWVTGGFNL